MLKVVLFIVFNLFLFNYSFYNKINKGKFIFNQKYFVKTAFANADDNNKDRDKNKNYFKDINYPLESNYILLWFNCKECNTLLKHLAKLNIPFNYIHIPKENNENIFPLLYKDDILIADDIFEIYKEIYKNV